MINPVNRSINERVIMRLEMSYNGQPWHGKNLKAILNMAEGRLSHRALSIVNHLIAWRDFVSDTLHGTERKIDLNTEADWPPVTQSEDEILTSLDLSQQRLINAIGLFDADKWHANPAGAKYTYLQLCHGVIDHDIYHSGQIAVEIKRGE